MSQIPPRPDVPGWMPPAPAPSDGGDATWRWWEALLVFVLGLVIASLLGAVAVVAVPPGPRFYVVALLGELVPFGVLLVWLRWQHPGWRSVMGLPGRWRDVGAGVLGGLAIYVVAAVGIGLVLSRIFDAVHGRTVDTPRQLPGTITGIKLVLAIVLAVFVAPIVEEFFFRGCLFRAIRARNGFWISAAGSSLIFGLAHYGPDKTSGQAGAWLLIATMFFVGLGLASVYERRGSIVASMAAHATFNIIGLFFIVTAMR